MPTCAERQTHTVGDDTTGPYEIGGLATVHVLTFAEPVCLVESQCTA